MIAPSQHEFCPSCQQQIMAAKALIEPCAGKVCDNEIYEQISYQFATLQSLAEARNKGILAIYARSLAKYARNLYNQDNDNIRQDEHALLVEGIKLGLLCEDGTLYEACPEMNYDKLWEFTQRLKNHRRDLFADEKTASHQL